MSTEGEFSKILRTMLLILLLSSSLAVRQGGNPACQSDHSFLLGVLRLAEYNDSCVESVLSYCSSTQGGCHFMPVVHELQENKEKLQEVKQQLQEVKMDTEEGKEMMQQELQENKEKLQEVKEQLQEVNEQLKEGKLATQEVKVLVQQKLHENKEELQEVKEQLQEVKEILQQTVTGMVQQNDTVLSKTEARPRHCKDLLDGRDSGSGLRQVYPNLERPHQPVTVYCDQDTDGGGWTVFQRRVNNSVRLNFERTWREYQAGFGDLNGEFWLGLDPLHELAGIQQELRVDLYDYEGQHRWAKYGIFQAGPEDTNYRLTVGRYSGDAGDSLTSWHNGQKFSTYDADHDKASNNCAESYRGAWWYKDCHASNLNGYQYVADNSPYAKGIVWADWRGHYYSLMRTTMMIRPAI